MKRTNIYVIPSRADGEESPARLPGGSLALCGARDDMLHRRTSKYLAALAMMIATSLHAQTQVHPEINRTGPPTPQNVSGARSIALRRRPFCALPFRVRTRRCRWKRSTGHSSRRSRAISLRRESLPSRRFRRMFRRTPIWRKRRARSSSSA